MLAVVSAGLLAAACGSAGGSAGGPGKAQSQFSAPADSPSASPAASPTPTVSQPSAPLTGLPTSAAIASRPAVALVVAGRDPLGLSLADVVFEEISTPRRYIAVFQSRQASPVGPITSTRPADGQILSVLRPLTGYDGGTTSFISVLDHAKITDLSYPAHSSLYHAGSRGVTASTAKFVDAARGSQPPELFSYRGAESGSDQLASSGEHRTSSVTVAIPGHGRQKWAFDPHTDRWAAISGSPSVQVANLIIQIVHYKTVFLSRKLGQTVPTARAVGRGTAEVFSGIADTPDQGQGGLSAAGTWSKPGLPDVTEYVDRTGFPMELQPGPTWVILAPFGTRVETVQAQP